MSQAERQALLEGLETERTALAGEINKSLSFSLPEGNIFLNGGLSADADAVNIEKAVQKAAQAVQKFEAAEVDALAAASKITVWTKVRSVRSRK